MLHNLNRKQKVILRGCIDTLSIMLFLSLLAIPMSFVFTASYIKAPEMEVLPRDVGNVRVLGESTDGVSNNSVNEPAGVGIYERNDSGLGATESIEDIEVEISANEVYVWDD